MSEMAKAARKAAREKVQRIAAPHKGDIDASGWTEPTINAGAKTGARPVSPRAFKRGGKVHGEHAVARHDRKPRKSGGSADAYVNRDVKEANEKRPGGYPHVGAFRKGGKAEGGTVEKMRAATGTKSDRAEQDERLKNVGSQNTSNLTDSDREELNDLVSQQGRKHGGRTKRMDGGPNVPTRLLNVTGRNSSASPVMPYKRGGKAHDDEKEDRRLIDKMVKPSARTGKKGGGSAKHPEGCRCHMCHGGKMAKGGEANYEGGTRPTGGRIARKHGGSIKGKGKTHINIMIAAGPHGGQPPGGPPMGAPAPHASTPVPQGMGMPPMGPPGLGGMSPPPGGMPPGMGGAGGPPNMPPPSMMGRKAGGRVHMTAGAGSGEGRLEKAEIQKKENRR